CGEGTCTVRCPDCLQSPVTCEQCFIRLHKHSPSHWAERWNGQHFEQVDISKLRHVITLGHCGNTCKNIDYKNSTIEFILVEVNGIHSTCLAFCACIGTADRVDQLMSSGIFPATVDHPKLGFTFNLLKDYHIHTLTSKKSAYDYDPYAQFLRVSHIWRYLMMFKRSGQAHDIDRFFPNRTPGNLVVPCFSCPEPG
ncbi:hypothetical protein PAXINDRAFT_52606, partial [Paxillus involutus ATCC 200175]